MMQVSCSVVCEGRKNRFHVVLFATKINTDITLNGHPSFPSTHHSPTMHAIKFAHYSYYCQQLQDIAMTQQEMDPSCYTACIHLLLWKGYD